jgi:hypothetical protein
MRRSANFLKGLTTLFFVAILVIVIILIILFVIVFLKFISTCIRVSITRIHIVSSAATAKAPAYF